MTRLHITIGENVDTLETYIESYQEREDHVCVSVQAPRVYQKTIFLDFDAREYFLKGGYQHLKPEEFVGLPVSVEYWGTQPGNIRFRDLDNDEMEGPMARVKRFQNGGAL